MLNLYAKLTGPEIFSALLRLGSMTPEALEKKAESFIGKVGRNVRDRMTGGANRGGRYLTGDEHKLKRPHRWPAYAAEKFCEATYAFLELSPADREEFAEFIFAESVAALAEVLGLPAPALEGTNAADLAAALPLSFGCGVANCVRRGGGWPHVPEHGQ